MVVSLILGPTRSLDSGFHLDSTATEYPIVMGLTGNRVNQKPGFLGAFLGLVTWELPRSVKISKHQGGFRIWDCGSPVTWSHRVAWCHASYLKL